MVGMFARGLQPAGTTRASAVVVRVDGNYAIARFDLQRRIAPAPEPALPATDLDDHGALGFARESAAWGGPATAAQRCRPAQATASGVSS